jgi:dinuclear metal center YbgI/SA1388 family protein
MDEWYDPSWAEAWDAVGLVCGDPDETVDRVVLAVDPVAATVDETLALNAGLLITHHPLLLAPVHGVPANDPRGALVHRMIRGGSAHLVVHTNADVADPGVSDALADCLGLVDLEPLEPQLDPGLVKLVVFVPNVDAESLVDALARAGAGAIGAYDRCTWMSTGQGSFRPLAGSSPTVGAQGEVTTVDETRVEMVVPPRRVTDVVHALRAAHPYEEPAFDLLAQVGLPTTRGIGRVGVLPQPMTLRAFTDHAAQRLPATQWGVRAAGDPDGPVHRVAVCGGAGGSYAPLAVGAGADVLLTSDLKHHTTLDAGIAVVDAAHWATESPWLDQAAARLRERFGTTVEVHVSRRVTDPWTLHASS